MKRLVILAGLATVALAATPLVAQQVPTWMQDKGDKGKKKDGGWGAQGCGYGDPRPECQPGGGKKDGGWQGGPADQARKMIGASARRVRTMATSARRVPTTVIAIGAQTTVIEGAAIGTATAAEMTGAATAIAATGTSTAASGGAGRGS